MARLPYLLRPELDANGVALWDSIVSSRGTRVVDGDGRLIGPFNAWLHAPDVGAALCELGASLRFRSSLSPRVIEIAVLTVGAYWMSEFEWFAHVADARAQGISDEVIESLARHEDTQFDDPNDRIIHMVAHQLVHDGQIGDNLYVEAHDCLGDRGMFELVSLCGYYTLMAFALNAFDVPLPAGEALRWNVGTGSRRLVRGELSADES